MYVQKVLLVSMLLVMGEMGIGVLLWWRHWRRERRVWMLMNPWRLSSDVIFLRLISNLLCCLQLVLVIGDFRFVRQRWKLNLNHDEEMPKIRGRYRPCLVVVLRSRISRHRNRRSLSLLPVGAIVSGSYIPERGIGHRCSTVSRERYCQCTVPTTASHPIVQLSEKMPCLLPTSPHPA